MDSFSQALAEALPQIVWTARPDGFLDYYNQRWFDYTGLTLEETEGWGWKPVLHPEDLQLCVDRWSHAVRTGEPYEIEYRFKRASDGAYRWHLGRALPARDFSGTIVKWFGTCTDIHEEKGAASRRRLDAERGRIATFIEALPVAVFVTDAAGIPSYSNAKARELLGEGVADSCQVYLVDTDVKYPLERMPLHRALRGESSSVDDMEIRQPGRSIPIAVDGAPAYDSEGNLAFAIAVFRDVSERKAMQGRLAAAERLASIGTLAGGVAHEINNPLSYVLSNLTTVAKDLRALTQTLLQGATPGVQTQAQAELADLEHALDDARQGAERIRKIVLDLKVFSRVVPSPASLISLEDVLSSSINIASSHIRHKAKVVTDFRAVPLVLASEPRLGQVFLNLLVNAAQAIPPGAASKNEVKVTLAEEAPGKVVVLVQDTGEGVKPENLARIFEPFFTTKPVGEGTGLGLSICHGIIKDLGGEIQVTSTLGVGTTFKVTLPAASAAESPRGAE